MSGEQQKLTVDKVFTYLPHEPDIKINPEWNLINIGQGYPILTNNEEPYADLSQSLSTITWNILEDAHALITGRTGSGKSVFWEFLTQHFLHHSDHCNIAVIDHYGIYEKETYMQNGNRYVHKEEEIINLMQDIYSHMQKTYEKMKTENVSHYLELQDPPKAQIIIVDLSFGLLAHGDNDEENRSLAEKIIRNGRSAGVHLILSAHSPTLDRRFSQIRDQFTAKFTTSEFPENKAYLISSAALPSKMPQISRSENNSNLMTCQLASKGEYVFTTQWQEQ